MKALRLACYLVLAGCGAQLYADAPIRTGVWVMQKLPPDAATRAEMTAQLRDNPNLSGVCLNFGWKTIEPEAGKPNFTALDLTVADLRKLGLKYQLCLKAGADTPGFVYAEGAQAFRTQVTNPHRANVGEVINIPIPWDPVYERSFSAIIKRLGDRYASDPLCVSVVLTCANFLSAEMHLPKTRSDLARWAALGDYGEKLFGVYQRYTSEWAHAFPCQEISLHLSKVLDLPPSFLERVIENGLSAYPQRFTLQNCQLSGRKEDIGNMSYELVMKYRDRAHHGFQSLAGLSKPNERMGSVEMAALNLVHAQGDYWELWHGDGLSPATSATVAQTWAEAKRLGYDAYKKKLISENKYRH